MAFEGKAPGALEYDVYRFGGSMLPMRGPQRPVTGASVACLGGTETFGKFVPEPYPALVEQLTGVPCVNMGVVHGGVGAFAGDSAVQYAARDAGCVVVQVMGAQTLSNRYVRVHPRRNDRFIGPTEALVKLYPDVDFTEFHFTRALLLRLRQVSRRRFAKVVEEMKRAWTLAMRSLVAAVERPVILLWVSDAAPPKSDDMRIRRDPLFVDADMIGALQADEVVEVVLSPSALACNTRGMMFGPMQAPMAAELLGPAGQCEVAVALSGVVSRIMDRPK
ncbi:DUF6473 family protein [Pseudaestuariivita atlantica]|uniref:DUF6473 domain-containing protein n=1 Tax=Pseudaestuariivita atlantica TaxID=1317121 RepID=A0A0L1JNA1_9RHOB|nr:DUF6473 family protein [Pseudaestuariivita atlantica]KNG93187.1 hypothetical protein ATO11_12045 [Pseudaestuariivita atlantica]